MGCAAFILLFRLGELPLLNPDEGRNAEIAREMIGDSGWLVPTYNNLPYLDKPALYFKTVALSMEALGVSPGAARVPSAVAALAVLALVFVFCHRIYNPRSAALAVVALASMPLFMTFGRTVIFDMPLTLWVTGAILAAFTAEQQSNRRAIHAWYALGALCAGIATLVKGPVGCVLPVVVVWAHGAWEGRRGVLGRLCGPINLGVFLATVLPWFLLLTMARPDFPYYGLVKETAERISTKAFDRTGPVYYYLPVLLGGCFPWSALFPAGVRLAWAARRRLQSADRLLVAWVVAVVAFFSVSQSKLPGYALPAVVPLGMLLGRLLDRAFAGRYAGTVGAGGWTLTALGSVLTAWLALEVWAPGFLARLVDLSGSDYQKARTLFPILLVGVVILGVLGTIAACRRQPGALVGAGLFFAAFVLIALIPALARNANRWSSAELARELQNQDPQAAVACLGSYPPDLAFLLGRSLYVVTEDGRELPSNYIPFFLEQSGARPAELIYPDALEDWLSAAPAPVWVIARPDRWSRLEKLAARHEVSVRALSPPWRGVLSSGRLDVARAQ